MANPKGNEASLKDSRFKAAWRSGTTRTIRVPVVLAEDVLEYAHRLDDGIESLDTMNKGDIDVKSRTSQFIDTSDSDTIETLKQELENTKASKQRWEEAFKESEVDRNNLEREVELHRSVAHQLREEYYEALKAEDEALKAATAPKAEIILPDAGTLLNRLREKRPKSKCDDRDIKAILDILES